MLIAAAIACGYNMHYNNFCGPNAFFAWSLRSWEPFEYHNNKEGHSGPSLDREWTKEKSKRLKELFGPNAPVKVSKEWEYLHKEKNNG